MTSTPKPFDRSEGAKRDIIAGGIVVAAILLFVGTGSNVMQAAVRALIGLGGGPDRALAAALVLNIALILFGWRRYEDLNREIRERTAACITLLPVPTNSRIAATTMPPAMMSRLAPSLRSNCFGVDVI